MPVLTRPYDPRSTIMVVDDEEMICTLIQTILETNGYHAISCTSGSQAAETTDEEVQHLDLLITDIRMPGVGGAQLAREFRAVNPDLPVIYISGYVGDAVVDTMNDPNALFLSKPFKVPQLLSAVQSLLMESGVR